MIAALIDIFGQQTIINVEKTSILFIVTYSGKKINTFTKIVTVI